ncbi:MAG TPA: hypothetical protein VGG15_07120 [Terriglobales bacterium]|jgi:hypothetical protein
MTLHRQVFISFLLLMVVYVFFSPLLPAQGVVGRHHIGSPPMAAAFVTAVTFTAASYFFPTAPEKHALHPERLFELHCARLC